MSASDTAEQLLADLAELAQFGADAEGSITRPAFSPAYRAAASWLIERMRGAGLSVRIDAAGNIVGRAGPPGSAVVCGSHIDTVPNGGRFDGALGVLAGLAVARAILPQAKHMKKAIEVIAFTDEEGAFLSLLGSRAMAGTLPPEEIRAAEFRGRRLVDAMEDAGLDPQDIASARRPASDFAAYLELHIEQGSRLEVECISIGIVEAICGIDVVEHLITGQANHSGTTPADNKRDALRAATAAMSAAYELHSSSTGACLNFGSLHVMPGAANIVPGQVRLTQEIRAASASDIQTLRQECGEVFRAAAKNAHVELASRTVSHDPPARMSTSMVSRIAAHCGELGLSHVRMPSGAGHDAQSFAARCDTGMIFVPSAGGVSHSAAEFTSAHHIGDGLRLLIRCIGGLVGLGAAEAATDGTRAEHASGHACV